MKTKLAGNTMAVRRKKVKNVLCSDFRKNGLLYVMMLPVLAFYIIFCYIPMAGIVISFEDFSMQANNTFLQNVLQSDWVGFKHFIDFFTSRYFVTILWNTVRISLVSILFGFPMPIVLALLMNEVRSQTFKRTVQTITYLPHFISLVVVCGMLRRFLSNTGFISMAVAQLTGTEPENLLNNAKLFLPIYVTSDIWQSIGWNSIIYMAALAGVDQELYEAASIDGAGRWKQTLHVTLPGIMPTIIIMLILRLGSALSVGYEKIILLYNPLTKPVAEVISSYVYQKGLIERNYSFSAAVGLFNSVVNFIFLVTTNYISRRCSETSLW